MAKKEFSADAPAAKGYETPYFDRLTPRRKLFVLHYTRCHDETEAAIAAGYVRKSADLWGFELGRHPDVVKAMEEVTSRRMNSSEVSRAAVIDRLKIESTVKMGDLCHEVELERDGAKFMCWKPLPIEDIEPQFRGCMGLVTVSREGNAQFSNTAQLKARDLLARYMGWDKESADTNPAITFDFSGLKD